MIKKGLSMVLLLSVLAGSLVGCETAVKEESPKEITYESLMSHWNEDKEQTELTCWYEDENDKEWLSNMSELFQKEYDIKVNPVYYDGVCMFDDINAANQIGQGPDVYLCSNDQLEYARNSGMASENTAFDDSFWDKYYPEVSKRALTYKGKQYGYPVYFDTYCLVYDAKLLESTPETIEDILNFADAYSDTGSTKAILRWDVADPYINNMFILSYANLFGENGDDVTQFEVYNDSIVENMNYYQSLSDYLWMDKNNMSHDVVKNRILDKTLVLGICKSDILEVLDELKGDKEVSYKLAPIPDLTNEKKALPFSTTYLAMVNPYSKDESLANMFACYLSLAKTELLYEGNGKMPVVSQKDFKQKQKIMYNQYTQSVPVPKVMLLGDYLNESAIAFDAIWANKDVAEHMEKLQRDMEKKIKN